MVRGKGQGYERLQEVDIVLYHAKTAERVIVMTFHCINWSKCISVLFTYYFEGSEFSWNGRGGKGGGGFEVSRSLVAPPPATFSRTRTSDPPRKLKDLSQDINQKFFFWSGWINCLKLLHCLAISALLICLSLSFLIYGRVILEY